MSEHSSNLAKYHIRAATSADIDGLVPLLKELFSIEADFNFNEALQRKGLEIMLKESRNRCITVAVSHEKVIGMASIQTLISTAEGGMVGLVEDLIVNKEWRGRGIGRQLLKFLETWAAQKSLKRIQLLADIENTPALEFYKRLNWSKTQLICLHKKEI